MYQWLRKIYLFPLMLLLGNVEGTPVAAAPDAGAVPSTPSAEAGGEAAAATPETPPETGAEPSTPSAEAGGESGATPTSQESAEAHGGKQPHQKTLDERVAELVSKKEVEIEQRLMSKLEESTKKETLDFIPDLDMAKVNKFIVDKQAEIDKALLDGEGWKAMELQDELNDVRSKVRDNEAKKADHIRRQEQAHVTEQQSAVLDKSIQDASKLVASEYKIPEQVWQEAETWFMAERRAKPIVDAQYRERVLIQGPVNALLWAKEYIEQNMGKKQEEEIKTIEAAKETLPAGKTSGGVATEAATTKLNELKARAASGNPSDLAAYSEYKRSLQTT